MVATFCDFDALKATRSGNGPLPRGVATRGDLPGAQVVIEQVRVDVERHRSRRLPEHRLDRFDVRSCTIDMLAAVWRRSWRVIGSRPAPARALVNHEALPSLT